MKINNQKIVNRWNSVMMNVGLEHLTIGGNMSELADAKEYYCITDGIDIDWMVEHAKYWLSCYYESGHCRCDDRFIDEDNYKFWRQETGMLKRLIARLEKIEYCMIVEW